MDDRTLMREALLEAQAAYDRGECPVGREARNPFSAACQAESRSLTLLRSLRRLAPIDQHPHVMKFRLDVIEARMTEISLQFLRGR